MTNRTLTLFRRGAVWYVRGTFCGHFIYASTKETNETRARQFKYKLEKMLSNPYREQEHSVYLIRSNTGSVKVGVSTDPRSRLAHIQKSTPAALVLDYAAVVTPDEFGEAAFVLESYAHSLMKDKRLHGEWFDTTSDHAIDVLRDASCSLGYELRRWL
ncbi:MAG: GIY-YIG nuclease family protein [Methylocella sp.]